MLILAIIAIDVAAISIWSLVNGANGFAEIPKLVQGQSAFISLSGNAPAKTNFRDRLELDLDGTEAATTPNPTFVSDWINEAYERVRNEL